MNRPIPQELMNIPLGQVFILTNPSLGIVPKNIFMMDFVFSMAKQYSQEHIVNALPVEDADFWDCFVCKVKTDEGIQILISNKDSIIEMLCEFWGLDYEEVCKSIKIPQRNKIVACGGTIHPMRVAVPARVVGSDEKDGRTGTLLQCLQSQSKENIMERLKDVLQDNFNHNLGLTLDDIKTIFEEEQRKEKKQYKLDIQFKWRDLKSGERKIDKCQISLIDNEGNSYLLDNDRDLTVQVYALYFTYVLFEDGLALDELYYNNEFYETYLKILSKFTKGYQKPTQGTVYSYAKAKMSVIRKAILDATKDNYAKEQFAIDGYEGEKYQVRGASDEDRSLIRNIFELE